MFECVYKYELEDCLQASKYVYKSSRRKQDKVISIMIPILMVCMLGLLILDIVKHRSVVWDVVLLVALIVLEVMNLMIPLTLTRSQKKSFKAQHLDEMEELHINIDDNSCVEVMMKDGAEALKNVHSMRLLTSYIEDDTRIVLVFNKIEFMVIRKDCLMSVSGKNKTPADINKFKQLLARVMTKKKK